MPWYDIEKFVHLPDPELICSICQCVFDHAVESPCRHVFCRVCLEQWLKNNDTCPTCRAWLLIQGTQNVLPLVQNVINKLLMYCDYRNNGCRQKLRLEMFDAHIQKCEFKLLQCPNAGCNVSLLRKDLSQHVNDTCEHRKITCTKGCNLKIRFNEVNFHNCTPQQESQNQELEVSYEDGNHFTVDGNNPTFNYYHYYYINNALIDSNENDDVPIQSPLLVDVHSQSAANEAEVDNIRNFYEEFGNLWPEHVYSNSNQHTENVNAHPSDVVTEDVSHRTISSSNIISSSSYSDDIIEIDSPLSSAVIKIEPNHDNGHASSSHHTNVQNSPISTRTTSRTTTPGTSSSQTTFNKMRMNRCAKRSHSSSTQTQPVVKRRRTRNRDSLSVTNARESAATVTTSAVSTSTIMTPTITNNRLPAADTASTHSPRLMLNSDRHHTSSGGRTRRRQRGSIHERQFIIQPDVNNIPVITEPTPLAGVRLMEAAIAGGNPAFQDRRHSHQPESTVDQVDSDNDNSSPSNIYNNSGWLELNPFL